MNKNVVLPRHLIQNPYHKENLFIVHCVHMHGIEEGVPCRIAMNWVEKTKN